MPNVADSKKGNNFENDRYLVSPLITAFRPPSINRTVHSDKLDPKKMADSTESRD